MKLARKFTITLVLGVMLVFGLETYLQTQRDLEHFELDTRIDQGLVAEAFRSATQTTWRLQGPRDARRLVEELNRTEPSVNLRWVSLDEPSTNPPRLTLEQREALERGELISMVAPDASGEERRITYGALPGAGGELLEVSESLAPQAAYILGTQLRVFLSAISGVGLSVLLAVFVGYGLVGRPVQQLRDAARRIGDGDLDHRVDLPQQDELGDLAIEINQMSGRLAEARSQLEAETEERVRAQEMLRHADRLSTVGQLASGVAHELGTPLNVVSGRARMIEADGLQPDERVRNARIIAEQADRMTGIIRQLLDFSRRRDPSLVPTDLRHLAAQTRELLASLARKRDVTLDVRLTEEALVARVDGSQIQQALTNLVMNAIQASDSGGTVMVTVVRGAEEEVGIQVYDEGHGISADDLPKLFDPFFTTKDVGEGTGLGLSVAYGLVHEHGGRIEVESEPEQGSRFTIWLPGCVELEERQVA